MSRSKSGSYVEHSFYCLNCGKKGIPIWRNEGHLRAKNHRKVLYCPFCQETVNHIELTSYDEIEKFKEDFEKGVYKDEAAHSLSYVRMSRLG